MELRNDIVLSKGHQKTLMVFPYFFIPALNEFYFLKDEFGFKKPKLATWKNEANLTFESKDIEIVVAFEAPNWIEIVFKKNGSSGRIYLHRLFKKLGIPIDKDYLTIQESKDLNLIQDQITERFQLARKIIKINWKQIVEYINNTRNLSDFSSEFEE